MSNIYAGGSGDVVRRLLEAYLAGQQEIADAEAAMTPEEIAAAEMMPVITGEQANFAGMMPAYDLEGDPYTMTSMLNQLQDVNQLLADPLFQGGGGVGAWGQQAFAPTVNYEVVDSPEYQRWMNYINTPLSPEGMIAAELQGGGTPMSAIRKIQQRVTEDPEGQLAQELAIFFPALDFDGMPTGEIDWTKASDAATQIDEIRSKIPPIGGTGSITMPDGTVVPAGEIMEVDGQLVKRTEEPSEMAQHFNELGLPSPFEEYTAGSFLGPEWEAQNQAWLASEAMLDPYNAAMREAYESMLRNENWVPPAGPAPTEQPEGGGGGINTVGTTNVPLTEGEGLPETAADVRYDPLSSAIPGNIVENPTVQQAMMIQDPYEFLEWYNANANQMNDEQRMSMIGDIQTRALTYSDPNDPTGARAGEWYQVIDRIQDDFEEQTPEVFGSGVAEAVGEVLEAETTTEADRLFAEASGITSPTRLRTFIEEHPELQPRLEDLGARALERSMSATGPDADEWGEVARDLMVGGTQVQGLMGPMTLEPNAKLPAGSWSKRIAPGDFSQEQTDAVMNAMWDALAQGEEPVPPPPGLSMEPSEADEWFGQQYPPAVPGEQPLNIFEPRPTYMFDVDERRAQAQRAALEDAQSQFAPSTYMPDVDERRAQAQRIAYERALVQAGGSPSDIPWATWDTPPIIPDTDERRAQAQREAMAQRQQELYGPRYHFPFNATGERVRMTEPVGIENEEFGPRYRFPFNATGERVRLAEPIGIENEEFGPRYRFPFNATGLPAAPGLTPEEIADIFPQGTGAITPENYGGGPPPQVRTGETQEPATEDQIAQYLENARRAGGGFGGRIRTGETAGRTEAERRRLARERTEEDWEYDPTTGRVNMRVAARNRFKEAYKQRSHALVARQQEARRIYGPGSGFGEAMAAVYRAQLSGASPLQQVYAQRVQNVANAGIPIGAQPGLISY